VTPRPLIGDQEASTGARPPVLAGAVPIIGRETVVAVALALLIIVYGNLVSLRPDDIRAGFGWAFMFVLVLGGLFLGLLRQRTGNLTGCLTFHWLVVTAMSGSLFLMSR